MRSKSQTSTTVNFKLILLCFFFLFMILLIIKSTFTQNPSPKSSSNSTSIHESSTINYDCASTQGNKTPPSLANALVHYATTNITPQQTLKEISVSLRVLEKKSPCNFLVFGLGHDSLMWTSLNHGGRTVFLEEDKTWISQIKGKIPALETYHIEYDTKVKDADKLFRIGTEQGDCKVVTDPRFSTCPLGLKGNVPSDVYDVEWDLIMVDAPTGYHDEAPGRMSALYTAGLMARNRESGETDVFVHDVDRVVEDRFSKAFLCEGYLVEQEGRLRHFSVPSHRTRPGRPYCP